jgi:dihydrodipicolinate synthase (EC 4.2.1.52)
MQFKGAFTALVTPFSNGLLDEEAYRQLIEWQLESGIQRRRALRHHRRIRDLEPR